MGASFGWENFLFLPNFHPLLPSANMADSCTYTSKPSQQVANDDQVAARSRVPTPIILEILDDEDEQLAAKVKQQQAELKKATDALEHAWSQKRKQLRKWPEHECEKKAACEMDEMA